MARRVNDLMFIKGLNETINQLAMRVMCGVQLNGKKS